jgi:carbon storage regulator
VLILTRRINEKIVIQTKSGEVIEVFPLGVNGSQVKIGVNAPRDTAIDREEIAQRKKGNDNANKGK